MRGLPMAYCEPALRVVQMSAQHWDRAQRWDRVANVGLVAFAVGAMFGPTAAMVGIPFVPAIWIPVAVLALAGCIAIVVGAVMAGRR